MARQSRALAQALTAPTNVIPFKLVQSPGQRSKKPRVAMTDIILLETRVRNARDVCLTAYEEGEKLKKQLVSIAVRIGEAAAKYEHAQGVWEDLNNQLRNLSAQGAV